MHTGLRKISLLRSILVGTLGGVAGSWFMCELRNRSKPSAERAGQWPETLSPQEGKASYRVFPKRLSLRADTTVTVASLVSETVLGHELSRPEKRLAGPLVHYVFGAGAGALYGALIRKFPTLAKGFGTLYGGLVWLAADEVALPALGVSKSPLEIPVRRQAGMLGLHLAYGFALNRIHRLAA